MRERVEILGVKIDPIGLTETSARIIDLCTSTHSTFGYTVTPNVDHVVRFQDDPDFRAVYDAAELVVPDGVPLLWASRLLRRPLPERVNGTDLVVRCCRDAARAGVRVFFMGGAPGTADGAARAMKCCFPELAVAGTAAPTVTARMSIEESRPVIEAIRRSRAHLVFVGLGSPKQEQWIERYGAQTGARHAIGIGASFDFLSGARTRAPKVVQRSGLEWLWRLGQEPRRLAHRYLVRDMVFFRLLALSLFASRRSEPERGKAG
jgi:N-acetylglucosaminyldiphosphoundecaprenol N-acetyl-beta-D-mannosaminyltransferase